MERQSASRTAKQANAAYLPNREVAIAQAYDSNVREISSIYVISSLKGWAIARGILVLTLASVALAQGPARKLGLTQMLNRVAAQAEAFRKIAPTMLADETLTQRTRKAAGGSEYDNA